MERSVSWRRAGGLALAAGLLATSAAGTAAQEPVAGDISFSLWQYEEPGIQDWWRGIVAAYEAEHGGTVTIRNLPIGDYGPQLTVEIANSAAADVILVPAFQLAEVAATGALMPLDDWLTSSGIRERVIQSGWDFTTVDGQVWAVPIQGRTLELIYNRCLFEEAGVSVPTSPEEFLAAARALTVKDGATVTQYGASMVNANETDPTYEMLLMWTIAHGGRFADEAGTFTVDSEPAIAALEFMKTLYDEELIPRGVPESDQRSLFATGVSAMEIDGQWQFPFIEEQNPDGIACFASAPHPWDGPGTGGASVALAVNASAADPGSALAFVELVTRPETWATFGDHSPNIPFGVDALTPEQLAARPYLQPWLDGITNSVWQPPKGHESQWSQIWPIVVEAVTATLVDDVPAAESLGAAQAALVECCSLD